MPEMRVTSYDRVSSFMLAVVGGLVIGVLVVVSVWYVRRPAPPNELVPLELLEVSGGFEDGNPDETWNLESPEPEDPAAALVEDETEPVSVEEVLENVVELSDLATEQLDQLVTDATINAGRLGSATGSGGRPLGMGPGMGGVPREQRWYIRFADDNALDAYARQLDHFGIELGVLLPGGRLVYVSGFSGEPRKRYAKSGKDEHRLYMTWQSGARRSADIQLLNRAGVPANRRSMIFHFYPQRTEQLLATLEFNYQKMPAQEIQRTYFLVKREGNSFAFEVTRQTLFR